MLESKNVWLIGGSSGIGESLAKILSTKVKSLHISARSEDKLRTILNEINLPSVFIQPCDVTELPQVKEAFEKIVEKCGSIDTVIFNAGIYEPTDVLNFKAIESINQMSVNYFGSLNVAENVIKHFVENKKGHLIVVSSQSAFRALPNAGGYGASKAALSYFFESLRMQVEDMGISISIIYPGFVKTRLTDKNSFEMPFIMDCEVAAEKMLKIVVRGKGDLGFPLGLSLPIQILRLLPEKIYRSLVKRLIGGEKQ